MARKPANSSLSRNVVLTVSSMDCLAAHRLDPLGGLGETRGEAIVASGELADLQFRRADLGRQVFQPRQLLLQRAHPFSQGAESLQLRDRAVGVLHQSLEIGVLGLQPLNELAQFGKLLGGTAPAEITEKGGHQALLLDEKRARLESAGWIAGVSFHRREGREPAPDWQFARAKTSVARMCGGLLCCGNAAAENIHPRGDRLPQG